MKSLFRCLFFAIAVCRITSSLRADDQRIEGQVFIATKGGENYKLALVTVGLYSDERIRKFIADKEAAKASYGLRIDEMMQITSRQYDAASASTQKIEDETYRRPGATAYNPEPLRLAQKTSSEAAALAGHWRGASNYLHSSLYYCADLPDSTVKAKTDAEGKFSFTVPAAGKWVLAATASRHVGDTVEIYDWLVSVDVNGPTQVMLANDNAFGGRSPECVVRDGVETNYSAVKGQETVTEIKSEIEQAAEATAKVERQRVADQEETRRRIFLAKLPQLVKESQGRALKKHPDLGAAGTPLNKKFVEEYKGLQAKKDPRLQEPDWPEKLADECAGPGAVATR